MSEYASLSRAELARALESLDSTPLAASELKFLLRELQRHQLELEMQNRELRETQHALEESRGRYVDLYDFAPMACVSLDGRACIRELNLTGASLLRRDRPHLLGQPFIPFVEPQDLSRFLQHVRQCLLGETQSTELTLRVGKERRLVRLHSAPFDGGEPHGHLCRTALLDITELRQMQLRLSLTERLATVGTLAAGVAHEINNPLTFVLGSLQLAARRLLNPSGSGTEEMDALLKYLTDARVGAERIQNIVRDLGTFSHPDERPPAPIDVRQVLELSVKMAQGELRHRARLVREYGPVPDVLADGSRLGQVFLNLLVNAAQAIPEGHAEQHEVRLRTWAEERTVCVEVRDTGQGIPPELLGRIFDPFFTTKAVGKGIGLGLSISHGLVTALGGELGVESEVGRGSVFRVRLPMAPGRSAASPTPPRQEVLRRARLLIVDDEPLLAQTLQMLLEPRHDVTVLHDAREALEQLRNGTAYDAILCDVMMAEMTGEQFYEELSRTAPEQTFRLIFMTGGAFTQTARDFLARVPNARLLKPFHAEELDKLLAPLLR
ncbi:PAS domain-containing protein [Archangium gephyra]|uniref:histidine kinase n=1 Tax=Archangium gephyra TaxID=48 RepID=A0AAC8Q2P1_9BACT|nr:ATP-binding protein [Archangium gephyra]AKI99785.1 Sensory box histidine kinase/response regulator [Archangium gephyra]REG27689.1 PAS domain-containing protein [Archangium gephyra]